MDDRTNVKDFQPAEIQLSPNSHSLTSDSQRPQVQFPVLHGRAPEISAGDGPGIGEQGVDDAVIQARHAFELGLVGVKGMPEGHEEETLLPGVGPGHGAAQHEGLRLEILLRSAFDMGGQGGVLDLFIVAATSPENIVLRLGRQRFKIIRS